LLVEKEIVISMSINSSVKFPQEFISSWTSLGTEFTGKDNDRIFKDAFLNEVNFFKEIFLQFERVIDVDSSFDMTSFKFIIIPAVYNDEVLLFLRVYECVKLLD
jgi:hypothetical protein